MDERNVLDLMAGVARCDQRVEAFRKERGISGRDRLFNAGQSAFEHLGRLGAPRSALDTVADRSS